MRDFAHEQHITHYWEQEAARASSMHLLPEQGVVVPGDLASGADSHTCTYGALGAFSLDGRGCSTDAGAWALQPVVPGSQQCSPTIRFEIEGELTDGATAKDVILHIIGLIGVDLAGAPPVHGVRRFYDSEYVDGRPHDHLEHGDRSRRARAGIMEVDDVARAWLEGRCQRPAAEYHAVRGCRICPGDPYRRGRYQAVRELAAPALERASRE